MLHRQYPNAQYQLRPRRVTADAQSSSAGNPHDRFKIIRGSALPVTGAAVLAWLGGDRPGACGQR